MLKLKVSFKSKPFRKAKNEIGELPLARTSKTIRIRYYERVAILDAPHRVSGQRRYPQTLLDRVRLSRFATEMTSRSPESNLPRRHA